MYFFFFKQKTAYEMRISDWSSDVCSSDLDLLISIDNNTTPAARVTNHFLGGDAAIDFVQPGPAGSYYLTTAEINQIVAAGGGGGEYDQVIEGTAAGEQLVGSTGKEIGRASCRERVGQYV